MPQKLKSKSFFESIPFTIPNPPVISFQPPFSGNLITDSDRAPGVIHDIERTEKIAESSLKYWRVPYFIGADDDGVGSPGTYRTVLACQFGSCSPLPMTLLSEACVWNCLQGNIPKVCTLGPREIPIFGSEWPTFGFDEFFSSTPPSTPASPPKEWSPSSLGTAPRWGASLSTTGSPSTSNTATGPIKNQKSSSSATHPHKKAIHPPPPPENPLPKNKTNGHPPRTPLPSQRHLGPLPPHPPTRTRPRRPPRTPLPRLHHQTR